MQKRSLFFAIVALASFSTVWAQCPEITIDQKYDHTPCTLYRLNGWDTAITCDVHSIVLNATPFITTQHFNGTYLIEPIPYNPPDTSFHAGQHLNISTDDAWENSQISFPFDFMFFGQKYNSAVVGSNGLVSFDLTRVGQHCPYMYSVPIPSPNWPTAAEPAMNAIYGIYEDIDPAYLRSNNGTCGMFRHVGGEYPCRYLSASVNGVDQFGNHNNYNTYQIVCYEGTNVIEVHVKERNCCSSTNSGKGIIGIQNATGQNQVSTKNNPQYDENTGLPKFTNYIEPNSPGAFVAPNRGNQTGGWTGDVTTPEAWRFTPQGTTTKNIQWWRLLATGDSVEVGILPTDANALATEAYYTNADHTSIQASPTTEARYMVSMKYTGANGHNYYLCDTIIIGMDTANTMNLSCEHPQICQGQTSQVTLNYPSSGQSLRSATWNARHVLNGAQSDLPETRYQINSASTQLTLRPADSIAENKIDTTIIYCTATFSNGCSNYDSIMIFTYPNFELNYEDGICEGQSYTFGTHTYTATGNYTETFRSEAGCDSVEHLSLTVYQKSYNVDVVDDCKPYTWATGNGLTYYESSYTDTIMLHNRYGCDSTVRLEFTLHPLTAKIVATPENATMDVLNILLTDASINGDSRIWYLPDGNTARDKNFQFSYPISEDSVEIRMHAVSQYGCEEDASIVIHMLKETFWMPNAFTPGAETNNLFRPYGIGLLDIQMSIFDRRGNLVYKFKDKNDAWDGKDMNGNDLPQGSYTYIVHYKNLVNPDKTNVAKGTITLIR
ncbi:MAG: gliding motility-associated C-terminal domain-containing protein [Bacteroidales bacterium]|nr:gliding motility-associated C-terminal domain-containing protein [Candidatus Colimorpha pelethequi]